MSTFFRHIPLAELTDLAEQRSPASEREKLIPHLSSCSACTSTLHQLEHVLGLMRSDTAEDAPRDAISRAIGLFQTTSTQQSALVRRVLAILSFDSLGLNPALGIRSGFSESRQLLYTAEDNDIDLHITAADNKWMIAGQVLGQGCQGAEVEIQGEGVSLSTRLNESCEFALPAVPSGDYKLRLRLSDIEVEVPRLELRK